MSDTVTFEITIPPDNEGYVLLQCQYCGEFFKCAPDDIESDEILDIYCPGCGMISDNYITDDVMQLALTMAENCANDIIHDMLKKLEYQNSSKNIIKIKVDKKPKHKYENPIYSSIDDLVEKQFACCNRSAKINPLLKMSASFCPFCGGITFAYEKK